MSTYVCSDIHGNLNRFHKMLEVLNLKDNDKLYILGDCIDRGNDGIEILKEVIDNKNIELLMGNHELFMYRFLFMAFLRNNEKSFEVDTETFSNIWFHENNGGLITYKNFLKEDFDIQFKIFKFLSDLNLIRLITINDKKFHLSHAGTFYNVLSKDTWNNKELTNSIREEILYDSPFDEYHLDYENDAFYLDQKFLNLQDYICISGHVYVQRIKRKFEDYNILLLNNFIDIDCGCAIANLEPEYQGLKIKSVLSCLKLEDLSVLYFEG